MTALHATLARTAATLKRAGQFAAIGTPTRRYYLHRHAHGVFSLTTFEGAIPARTRQGDIKTAGPLLWKRLEDGADTPEKRLALAHGMVWHLPCGECREHWALAIEARPPPVETAEAFDRWQWGEHNRINKRKGKPFFPWKKYAHKKK